MLLSKRAQVHSTPALEILTDDVKCKHGSATGQIDQAQLFYLRSRGIDAQEATRILTRAFAAEIVSRLDRAGHPCPRGVADRAEPPGAGGGRVKTKATARPGVPSAGAERDARTVALSRPWTTNSVRADFPILSTKVHEKPLVYLDSAASAQKPRAVINAERRVYEELYANIHRGVHDLSMRATDAYESARGKVARFVGAPSAKEIILPPRNHGSHQPRGPDLRPHPGQGRR